MSAKWHTTSGYVGMGNDPVNNVDPSGGFAGMSAGNSALLGAVGGAMIGGTIGMIAGNGDPKAIWNGAAMGALGGAAIGSFSGFGGLLGTAAGTINKSVASSAMDATIQLEQQGNSPRFASSNPVSDGRWDAIKNALLLGGPDLYNAFWGNDPTSDYLTETEKDDYVTSRMVTDGLIATIAINVSNGSDAAAGGAQLVAIAGSGTVVVGIGAEILAGAAKILSLYGKSVAASAVADVVYMAKYNVHHNDPKWAGGDPKQPYQTTMTEADHQALHKAMNDYMKKINKLLVPVKGNNGKKVRGAFDRNFILEKLAEFYRSPVAKETFKEAADNFFKLHPSL